MRGPLPNGESATPTKKMYAARSHLSRTRGRCMWLVSHAFPIGRAAGTISFMSLQRLSSIAPVVSLPLLLLLIGTTSCSSDADGTISIVVTGGRGASGLGVEDCERFLDPNEVLKVIVVRDEGAEVARMTVLGRDATAKKVGVDGRRCAFKAVMNVPGRRGEGYEITADGETKITEWEIEYHCRSLFGSCTIYYPTTPVEFLARGEDDSAAILGLMEQGYVDARGIAREWHISIDRARQLVQRDDFPAPAEVVGAKKLWLPKHLEAWRHVTPRVLARAGRNTGPHS